MKNIEIIEHNLKKIGADFEYLGNSIVTCYDGIVAITSIDSIGETNKDIKTFLETVTSNDSNIINIDDRKDIELITGSKFINLNSAVMLNSNKISDKTIQSLIEFVDNNKLSVTIYLQNNDLFICPILDVHAIKFTFLKLDTRYSNEVFLYIKKNEGKLSHDVINMIQNVLRISEFRQTVEERLLEMLRYELDSKLINKKFGNVCNFIRCVMNSDDFSKIITPDELILKIYEGKK